MQEVLARLDNPHLNLPPTIHVAGTNGKGSTIAFLRAILESSGKKVHTYTTPHLIKFNERITLAGEEISDDYLFETMEEVRLKSEDLRLGFFEATTAGAFLAFSKVKADYLLLETGMGGRLDATNIIPAPLVTIITTIAKDHTEFLGTDLRLIAGEKLGIVKPGTTCISSLQQTIVDETIETYCAEREIPLVAFSYDFAVDKTPGGFRYICGDLAWEFPDPALPGDHQYVNAASAITAYLLIKSSHPALDAGSPEIPHQVRDVVASGLQKTKWPSRLERIARPYIPENWEFWLDGAHNPAGAFALANHLQYWQDKPTYLIFGTTKGREVKDFLAKFQGKIAHLCLVKIKFEPNSYEPEEMLPFAEGFEVSTHDDLQAAIKHLTTELSSHTSELSSHTTELSSHTTQLSSHTTQLSSRRMTGSSPYPTARPRDKHGVTEGGRILACGSLFMRGDI